MKGKKLKIISLILLVSLSLVVFAGCASDDEVLESDEGLGETQIKVINGVEFELSTDTEFFTWDELPSDVSYQREEIQSFENDDGNTHYYEAVYVPTGNLNWYQAAYLAEEAGGYLVSITSEEENEFVFGLVSDEKYFWTFPEWNGDENQMNHYEIMIGPHLGGYQILVTENPDLDWNWMSGEAWEYTNWAVNLDDGIIDQDPRDNTQPNDSGDSIYGQRVLGFGEMNAPVSTWGDYSEEHGTYGLEKSGGKAYGFIIEYETTPMAEES